MKEYEFTLKFVLPDRSADPSHYLEKLAQTGCEDALVGVGQRGRIALHFNREAPSALDAFSSGIKCVYEAIPGARFVESSPDLVGLSDLAELLGVSRQYMRKLMLRPTGDVPAPIHEGHPTYWRLATVLQWLHQGGRYEIDPTILDVAQTNMHLNILQEASTLDPRLTSEISKALS